MWRCGGGVEKWLSCTAVPCAFQSKRFQPIMSSSSDDDLSGAVLSTPAWQSAVQSLQRSSALAGTVIHAPPPPPPPRAIGILMLLLPPSHPRRV